MGKAPARGFSPTSSDLAAMGRGKSVFSAIKAAIKRILAYRPLAETSEPRALLSRLRTPDRPYCSADEGDFIHSLIVRHGLTRCLETGFGTGSTAIYMLHATRATNGRVTSVDWSPTRFNEIGRANIAMTPDITRHCLIEEKSETVLPRLYLADEMFDFVFVDGWKAFDHLVFEAFLLNRMLPVGGVVFYDDANNQSVRRVIALLKVYYGYVELERSPPGGEWGLRLFEILTRRNIYRPYRALRKTVATDEQPPGRDPYFYRPF